MKKRWRVMLVLVAIACFAVALSYPIKYKMEEKSTEETMERLVELRNAGLAKRGAREGREDSSTAEENEAGKESAEESEPLAESERPEGTAPSGMEGAPEEESNKENQQAEEAGEAAEESSSDTGSEPSAAEQLSEASEPNEASNEQSSSQTAEAPAQTQPGEEAEAPAQSTTGEAQSATEAAGQSAAPDQIQPEVEQPQPGEASPQNPPETAQGEGQTGASPAQGQTGESVAQGQSGAAEQDAGALNSSSTLENATPEPTATPAPTRTPQPTVHVDRFARSGAETYAQKEKRTLEVDKILPQYQEIYAENQDFAGWITIPDTVIDYPVVQTDDSDFYLHHDFFGQKNANGQIILDSKCDPYTPSYNLVISGHSMRSGKMFGRLVNYMNEGYWEDHKLVYFDTLMDERTYVVFAAFFSADYDVDETGFRYNADIQYSVDARNWLREVKENELYDTGIDVEFGDEFLTLTTCNKAHRSDGRFVVVCRRLREGEEIE